MKDLYELLGIQTDSSTDEIRDGFRKAAKKTHPDKKGGSEKEFHEVNKAWMILRNPTKRRKYDDTGDTEDAGNREPSLRELAVANLCTVLSTTIGTNMCNETILRLDLFGELKKQLKEDRAKQTKAISNSEKALKTVRKVLAKLKYSGKEGKNIFEESVLSEVAKIEGSVKATERNIEVLDLMSEILEDYEYSYDKVEPENSFNPMFHDQTSQAQNSVYYVFDSTS